MTELKLYHNALSFESALDDADVEFHRNEYETLRLKLMAAHQESSLPEEPTDSARRALNDLLVRIRLAAR